MKNYFIPALALTFSAVCGYSDGSRVPVAISEDAETFTQDDAVFDLEGQMKTCRTTLAQLAKENKTCLEVFDEFSQQLDRAYREEGTLTSADLEKILTGVVFAAEKHKTQVRKNKEQTPYISHPIGVAAHLMKVGQVRDPAIIIAALLHDTVEDTETTYTEIETLFGKDVANYVNEVTDDKSLSQRERKRLQVIQAAHKSTGAAQIKLADKLYNLNDLFNNPPAEWSRSRIDQYYQWAQSVINRLPASNDQLKDAVDSLIHKYWEAQKKTDENKAS